MERLNGVRCDGVLGRVPTFQPGGPGKIPSGIRNFNFSPGTRCVSLVCVLSCVVSCGGPDIMLTTHLGRPAILFLSSVLVYSLFLLLKASEPWTFGL